MHCPALAAHLALPLGSSCLALVRALPFCTDLPLSPALLGDALLALPFHRLLITFRLLCLCNAPPLLTFTLSVFTVLAFWQKMCRDRHIYLLKALDMRYMQRMDQVDLVATAVCNRPLAVLVLPWGRVFITTASQQCETEKQAM